MTENSSLNNPSHRYVKLNDVRICVNSAFKEIHNTAAKKEIPASHRLNQVKKLNSLVGPTLSGVYHPMQELTKRLLKTAQRVKRAREHRISSMNNKIAAPGHKEPEKDARTRREKEIGASVGRDSREPCTREPAVSRGHLI